jgi:two-component sensor histidine kinase
MQKRYSPGPEKPVKKLMGVEMLKNDSESMEIQLLRSQIAALEQLLDVYERSVLEITDKLYKEITERKKAEEEIKRQLAEKETLLKEVHHRIKNNIASIGGILSLHVQSIANPEAIAVLQDAIGRVDSMQILYDKLLLSEDYKDISVKNYVESLTDTVSALFSDSAKVTIDKRIADFQLDPKRLFPLGIIINELLTNKMKYAFINRDAGLIKISLKNVKNHITLTIQDNGNGLPDGFDINESKGFGLKLVKMLSRQLGGSFSIKKHAGTRSTIEFNI